eukprot:9105619-Pyramimonas_sp.AAC.1
MAAVVGRPAVLARLVSFASLEPLGRALRSTAPVRKFKNTTKGEHAPHLSGLASSPGQSGQLARARVCDCGDPRKRISP